MTKSDIIIDHKGEAKARAKNVIGPHCFPSCRVVDPWSKPSSSIYWVNSCAQIFEFVLVIVLVFGPPRLPHYIEWTHAVKTPLFVFDVVYRFLPSLILMVFSIELITLGQEPLSEICRVKSCTLLFLLNLPYLWFVFVTFVQCLQFNAHILYIVPSLSLCYFIILISSHEVRPYFFTHHRLCENPLKMGELRRGAIICWHPNPHLQLIGGREHTKYQKNMLKIKYWTSW